MGGGGPMDLNFNATQYMDDTFEFGYLGSTFNAFKSNNYDSMHTLCRQSVYRTSQNSCFAFNTKYIILCKIT
jgi:hypothetical protein